MSAKACKLKVCICASVAETEALAVNYEAIQSVIATLGSTDDDLVHAGIDEVLAVADATVQHLRKLNDVLVACGVKLSEA